MQNSNCNNRSPFGKIFTLLAFILGVILFIILRQTKNEQPKEEEKDREIKIKPKSLPKKVNKEPKVEEEIETINLTDRQKTVIKALLEKGKIYPSELQDLLPNVSTRTIRRDMNSLEKKGLVEQKGTTKSTYYIYIGS